MRRMRPMKVPFEGRLVMVVELVSTLRRYRGKSKINTVMLAMDHLHTSPPTSILLTARSASSLPLPKAASRSRGAWHRVKIVKRLLHNPHSAIPVWDATSPTASSSPWREIAVVELLMQRRVS